MTKKLTIGIADRTERSVSTHQSNFVKRFAINDTRCSLLLSKKIQTKYEYITIIYFDYNKF